MADLENGLFSGANVKQNTGDPSISYRFFTAALKGQPNQWALRGANAVSGALSTFYNGVRPKASGYNPMSKEGAIILGKHIGKLFAVWYELESLLEPPFRADASRASPPYHAPHDLSRLRA